MRKRMKMLFALAAVVGTLVLSGVAAGGTGIQYNVEGGGATPTGAFYIARVYIYYGGYWHWLNCEYVMYSDGSALQTRCW
jgi:hypothetical protein